jgi:hypothetical protein
MIAFPTESPVLMEVTIDSETLAPGSGEGMRSCARESGIAGVTSPRAVTRSMYLEISASSYADLAALLTSDAADSAQMIATASTNAVNKL